MNKKNNIFWLGVVFILHILWAIGYGIIFWGIPKIIKLF